MASDNPMDKNTVFRKLKAKSGNKVCFDCNAKNLSMEEEVGLPSSLVASQSAQEANGLLDFKILEDTKESRIESKKLMMADWWPWCTKAYYKASYWWFPLDTIILAAGTSESVYDQKPEEPTVPVPTSTSNTPPAGSSFASRFEYVENVQSAELSSGGPQVLSYVAPTKSTSFFADYGMDNGFQKKASSSKVQSKATDIDSQVSLQKFSGWVGWVCESGGAFKVCVPTCGLAVIV
ncbi:hypothetical protein Patl1_03502 [Pistacia atlantica]|uniref:Uncharacterized protein n=1 Tax=Pistacia atlantica TaxID=434234 RepID=A0ACC1CAV5_9ROSI|nr:hypothetical protein Patl1_03502 [Pistacia atlantica]